MPCDYYKESDRERDRNKGEDDVLNQRMERERSVYDTVNPVRPHYTLTFKSLESHRKRHIIPGELIFVSIK